MKIRGLKVEEPRELKQTIYTCPYCSKRFFNKGSYYNHIDKKYCRNFFSDFEKKKQEYNDKKITKKEYWTWCYENGYTEFLDLNDATLEELGQEFYDKICNIYNYCEEDY